MTEGLYNKDIISLKLEGLDTGMKKQTFVLEIIENQNENWQGNVKWVQGKQQKSFRSILELMSLLESAVEDGEEKGSKGSGELWNS